MSLRDTFAGAAVAAVLSVGAMLGVHSKSSDSGPRPPSAPALESGQAVKYFCKADLREAIDQSPPGSVQDATHTSTTVLHTCYAPDGTVIHLSGSGQFISASDGKGLPLTEAQVKGYLR